MKRCSHLFVASYRYLDQLRVSLEVKIKPYLSDAVYFEGVLILGSAKHYVLAHLLAICIFSSAAYSGLACWKLAGHNCLAVTRLWKAYSAS